MYPAITRRSLDGVICGICGTVGELHLGDGNEKNGCSIGEVIIFKGYKCNYTELCVCSIFLCIPLHFFKLHVANSINMFKNKSNIHFVKSHITEGSIPRSSIIHYLNLYRRSA